MSSPLDLHYLITLCVILKTFGWKTTLVISKQLFIDGLLMILFTISIKDHVEKFRNYLNKQHENIKFISKIEENGSLSF